MCFKWHRSIRQHDNGPWKTYMTCLTCSRAKTSGLHLGRLRQRRCERQKRLTNWQALGKHSQGMANRQFSFHPATELQFSLIDCQVWLGKSSFNQVVRHHVQHILLMFIVWYILSSWSNRGTSFLFFSWQAAWGAEPNDQHAIAKCYHDMPRSPKASWCLHTSQASAFPQGAAGRCNHSCKHQRLRQLSNATSRDTEHSIYSIYSRLMKSHDN